MEMRRERVQCHLNVYFISCECGPIQFSLLWKKTSAKLEVPSKRNDVHLLLESSVDKLGEVLLKLKVSKTFLQVS